MKPITVGALIAELQKMPQAAFVLTEGCDCEAHVAASSCRANR